MYVRMYNGWLRMLSTMLIVEFMFQPNVFTNIRFIYKS